MQGGSSQYAGDAIHDIVFQSPQVSVPIAEQLLVVKRLVERQLDHTGALEEYEQFLIKGCGDVCVVLELCQVNVTTQSPSQDSAICYEPFCGVGVVIRVEVANRVSDLGVGNYIREGVGKIMRVKVEDGIADLVADITD